MLENLAPGMLIAGPSMSDPRFKNSVIFLAESNSDGALGFVLNQVSDLKMSDLSDTVDVTFNSVVRHQAVFKGGPVSPERGWVLCREQDLDDENRDQALLVVDGFVVSPTLEVLQNLVADEGEPPFRLLLGCAGWGPKQLEEEIAEGSWIPLSIQPDLLLNSDIAGLWAESLARVGISAGLMLGSLPAKA